MDEVLLAKSATLERCLRRIAEEFTQTLLRTLSEAQTAEKQPTNPHTFSPSLPVHPRAQNFTENSERAKNGGKMNPRMPKAEAPKLYLGVHARLVFLKKEDEQAVLDLMRRFSSATRFAYNRLLEGQDPGRAQTGEAAPSAPSSASTPATPMGP
jgi:hypothetical protein